MSLMHTFDALPVGRQAIAKAMLYAAREVLEAHDIRPRNDDAAAILEEACAVYLLASINPKGPARPVAEKFSGYIPHERTFKAHWGEGYGDGTGVDRTVDGTFFCNDNGYDAANRKKVHALEVGQSADLSDISGKHTVTRES